MNNINLDFTTSFSEHLFDGVKKYGPYIPSAIFDLLVGILIIRITVRISRRVLKWLHIPAGMRGVTNSIFEIFLWAILLITLLNDLHLQSFIYFFSGSIAAIGIAMAAGGSTLVSDIVAGIFLARDNDFNVGDEVIAGETPTQGIIERMDARRTRLRDKKGVLHVIPNSLVERKEWVLVKRRSEISALSKAAKMAKQIGAAARERTSRS